MDVAPGEPCAVVGAGIDEYDRAQVRQAIENGEKGLGERRGDNDRSGAAVAQDIGVLVGGEQRVERQHHDPGAHAAPERDWKIHGVVEQERQPLFGLQPKLRQRAREPAGARSQLTIAERTLRIDKGNLFAKAARDRCINEISDGVVRLALQQVLQHGLSAPPIPNDIADAKGRGAVLFVANRSRRLRDAAVMISICGALTNRLWVQPRQLPVSYQQLQAFIPAALAWI